MNDSIAKLLQPISAEQPCGADLSYDPRFGQLETLLAGKPEVEIGSVKTPAEPPDWRELRAKSTEFLGESKHLRVAVILCVSLLKTGGLAGFNDGLALIRGLLEQFWPSLFPVLDPEDNNDPTQRLNILSSLSPRRESIGLGWMTILDYLGAAPLCQAKGAPPITFELLQAARMRLTNPNDPSVAVLPSGMDLPKLESAMRAADREQLTATHQALVSALDGINGVDLFLTGTLGAGNTISFEGLQKLLAQMIGAIKPFLSTGEDAASSAAGEDAGDSAQGADTGKRASIQVSGPIRSREDVQRAIDRICDYYRQVEPSSPVPYILRRAHKMAGMNFVEAVQELNLGTLDALRPSMGSGLENASAPTDGASG